MPPLLTQTYVHEIGNSPDLTFPALENGDYVQHEYARSLYEKLFDADRSSQHIGVVASYTLLKEDPDAAEGYRIWIGARREDDTIHPNVFSMPTYRIPPEYLSALLAGKMIISQTGNSLHLAPNWQPGTNKDAPAVDRADHIGFAKLGLPFQYMRSQVFCSVASVYFGVSSVFGYTTDDPNPREMEEALLMPNIVVLVGSALADRYPAPELEEYPETQWVCPDQLLKAANTRDVGPLIPEHSDKTEVDLCIHGVCVESTVNLLTLSTLQQHVLERPVST